jgi:DNA ligase-1
MSIKGTPAFTYWVFDLWNSPAIWAVRKYDLDSRIGSYLYSDYIRSVRHVEHLNRERLDEYELQQIDLGHEGIMLNDPNAKYKFGRATTKGGELLKVKRFVDSEAEVIGVEEEMHNANEAQTNELGRTKRSTAQAGLTGKGTMGALIVRDLKTKIEFNIGTGFTAEDRKWWWNWFLRQDENTPKPIIKYKFFPVGVKDKPRHPVYLGLRPAGA